MQYIVSTGDSARALADLIRKAQAGDVIVMRSEAMKDLAERAKAMMCPEKHIVFKVEKE